MNELDFSLGRAFPIAHLWHPTKGWGVGSSFRQTSQRTGQYKGSLVCPTANFCFRSWLRMLQWARNEIQASVSFYSVRECATDKERGSQYLIPESRPSPLLHCQYPSPKVWGGAGGSFSVCYPFADSEMSEIEKRCFNEVIPTLENSEFKIYFLSQLSLIWLISNLKKLYHCVC